LLKRTGVPICELIPALVPRPLLADELVPYAPEEVPEVPVEDERDLLLPGLVLS